MKTIEETYRDRLGILIDEFGGATALSKATGKSPSQISQWLHGLPDSKTGKPRSLKAETAREIEKATGKPYAWFDQPVSITNNGTIGTQNNVSGSQYTNNFYQDPKTQTNAAQLSEKEAQFLTAMPLLGIDDGVAYAINPSEMLAKIQDTAERAATYIPHSDMTFGVKVADNTLKDISEQHIQINDILIIEPRIAPRHQDLVLICLDYQKPTQRGIFARLSIDLHNNQTIKYSAADPEKLPENALICGVVVEIKRRLLPNDLVASRIDENWNILNTLAN